MHILVLGAGAIGSLLGARLSTTSARVTLLTIDREHVRAVQRNGLVIEELDGGTTIYKIPCYEDPRSIGEKADLVLVAVKTYATEKALSGIGSCCSPSTLFLTLQNGIGNWERIAGIVGREPVLVGVTAQGATLTAPGRVRHGGNGPTYLGEITGPPESRVEAIAETFRNAGLETFTSDRMEHLIWEKLLVNVGINAITALAGIRNGMIAELEPARKLCAAAVEEAVRVAAAKGFPIREDIVERVLSVARATAVNRSSMGQDVDKRKRTEIDAINGAIVKFAAELGIPAPVNWTLTHLVKTVQESYLITQ